jgi:hypothetical protein
MAIEILLLTTHFGITLRFTQPPLQWTSVALSPETKAVGA